jgi:hypothetical protein
MTELHPVDLARIPYVDGVLTADQVAQSAASIAAMQEPSGAVPWTVGEHVDIWNHVEAAMAMLVGGQVEAAERAYAWVPTMQRADGSWPMKIVAGEVDDPRGEVNMSAYFAVGLWHHWLVRRDIAFVRRYWPSVRAGLDWVVSQQVDFGGINWTPTESFSLLAGSSSIYQSLRAGVALADLLDDPQPEWELAGGRLGHAVREHRDLFADRRRTPWTGTTRCSAARCAAGRRSSCWTAAGTSSWCPGSASTASTPTPGSPARRPASSRWRWTSSVTTGGRSSCSPTCSTCAPRTASTGPAGSTVTRTILG